MTKRIFKSLDLSTLNKKLDDFLNTIGKQKEQEETKHKQLLEFVKKAHDGGLSLQQIADLIGEGVSKQRVNRWLKETEKKDATHKSQSPSK